jgi:hypothetical protein
VRVPMPVSCCRVHHMRHMAAATLLVVLAVPLPVALLAVTLSSI